MSGIDDINLGRTFYKIQYVTINPGSNIFPTYLTSQDRQRQWE